MPACGGASAETNVFEVYADFDDDYLLGYHPAADVTRPLPPSTQAPAAGTATGKAHPTRPTSTARGRRPPACNCCVKST
ncbi:MAG: hypothetical protein R2856_34045 [Caldilineaceae bacterium]